MEQRVKALLIEDDPDYTLLMNMYIGEACGHTLRYELECADSLRAGIDLLARAEFDIVLTDLMLPDSRGLETLAAVQAKAPGLPIVVLTNIDQDAVGLEAIARGAQDFLSKNKVDGLRLRHSLGFALARNRLYRQMESLVDGSPDGMVIIDSEGMVRYANPAAVTLFGKAREELVGRLFEHQAQPGRAVELSLPGPGDAPVSAEMRVAEIEWRGYPARLASIRDVTEFKKLEEARAEVRERTRMDQMKDQLLSTVAHELRTPLSIIKAIVGTIRDGLAGPLTKDQTELITSADRNVNRLTRLLNNFLDLSRLESRRARVSRRPLDPLDLIREVTEGIRMANRGRPIVFLYDLPDGAPLVHVDADMIAQVLSNLLDNAMRYARARVLVRATVEREAVEVSVVDDGPGIPPDKFADLFDKFVQLDRPRGGSGYKGTGLGLAISREIMGINDGKIWAENADGRGACFRFTLPLAFAAGRTMETTHAPGKNA